MATYNWSTLIDGTTIGTFNPASDVLRFDDASIFAAGVRITPNASFTSASFMFGPKTVNVAVDLRALVPASVTFNNASRLVTGDDLPNALTGGGSHDQIRGFGGNDTLSGGGGNDLLIGDGGNDTLDGGSGADTMIGGTGDDFYYVHDSGDLVVELAGEGADTVWTVVNYTLADNVEQLMLGGSASLNATGNGAANSLFGNNGANVLFGGGGNDTIRGAGGNDNLIGDAGDDAIDGGEGDDTLNGGSGNDTMTGGNGNDSYFVDSAADKVIEAAGGGTDTVTSLFNYTLADTVEHLILGGTAALNGTGNGGDNSLVGNNAANVLTGGGGNDTLRGNGGNDTLNGEAGNDSLDGGANDDAMTGGIGNDTYFVDSAGDTVTELAGGGTDTVFSSVSYSLGAADVENLFLTGAAAINGTGNALANLVVGNSGNNRVDGGLGNDNVQGGDGDDVVIGGDGNDNVQGGAGNDRLNGGNGTDFIDGGTGVDTLDRSGAGVEQVVDLTLNTNGTDTLANIENAIGSMFSDALIGNAGANALSGGEANDFLEGRGGNDTLDGGENPLALLPDVDTVNYLVAGVTGGVRVDLQDGSASDGFGATDRLRNVERVIGTQFADELFGGDPANVDPQGSLTFAGRGGNDTIDGRFGNAWAEYRDAAAGIVVDLRINAASNDGDGGSDVLLNINRVRGSAFVDRIDGKDTTSGNERFEGMAGADRIDGHGGIDYLEFRNSPAGVIVAMSPIGGGIANDGWGASDIFFNIEGLRGSQASDFLIGSGRTDEIERFEGMAGNDLLFGDFGLDRVEYGQSASGVIVSLETQRGEDGFGFVDTLSGIEQATGSRFGDLLIGNDSDNELRGEMGNDVLRGGIGNDLLDGGENLAGMLPDNDTVDYFNDFALGGVNVNLATGTVTDGFGYTDTLVDVERVIGTGLDDFMVGGGAGNDDDPVAAETFAGRGGHDIIVGGGGAFNTWVEYRDAAGAIAVDLQFGETSNDGDGSSDQLTHVNRVRGSGFGDVISGSDITTHNERFEGMAGNDTIDGRGGLDYLDLRNSPAGVSVTLSSTGSGIMGDGWGSTDTFSNIEGVRSTQHNDVLQGSNRTDVTERFEGMGGNDAISGAGGTDRVEYTLSTAGVVVDLAAGTALDGFGGTDTLSGIEEATGSRFDDVITGGTGANFLDAGVGADTVTGGRGNDVLLGGAGADRLVWLNGDGGTATAPALDTVGDFVVGTDVLDLRSLLVGEAGNAAPFFDFLTSGGSTTIRLSTQGNGAVDQLITLSGVDLNAGNTMSDSATLASLLGSGSLLIDL